MKQYYRSVFSSIVSSPKKIPAFFRLATGFKRFARRNYLHASNVSTAPVTVSIRLTYRCNLRCVQCGQWGARGALNGREKELLDAHNELTTGQIKRFIDEIAWFRPYISFTGGEPLLREDIGQLIRYANTKHLLVSMNTNGTLLGARAEEIITSGLSYVFSSLDGPPGVNENIRIGADSTVRAVEGIKTLLSLRKKMKRQSPLLQVQFTLTRENQYAIWEAAKFCDEILNVDVFGIVPGVFTTEELSNETSIIYQKKFGIDQRYWAGFVREVNGIDYAAIEEQMQRIRKTKWKFLLRIYPPMTYKDFSFQEHFCNPRKAFGNIFCATVYVFTQLQPNGDIATCGSQPDYIAGNILQERFMDIWNGQRYRSFREQIKNELFPSCARCWALYEFNHGKEKLIKKRKA